MYGLISLVSVVLVLLLVALGIRERRKILKWIVNNGDEINKRERVKYLRRQIEDAQDELSDIDTETLQD